MTGETVARAVLEITADNTKYLASIKGMSESLVDAFDSPIESIKSVTSSIGGQLLDGLKSVGPIGEAAAMGIGAIAVAGVAVAAGLFSLASSAAHAGDEVKDFHEKTGIAVTNIGKWDFATKAAGGSLGDLTKILQKLEIGAATDQGGKFAAALKDIGINADAFKTMDSEQQLKAIAAGFQRGAASGNDMAAATALMGKQGAENIPLLKNLTGDLLAQGEKLGVQWSNENVNAADDFKVALSSIETGLGSVGTKIGVAVLPAISDMLSAFASSPAFMDIITTATDVLAKTIAVVVEVIGHLVQITLSVLAPAIGVIVGAVMFGVEIFKALGSVVLWAVDSLMSFTAVRNVVSGIGSAFGWLKDTVTGVVKWIVEKLESIPIVGPKIKAAADTASAAFTNTMSAASAVGSMTDKLGSSLWSLGGASISTTAALNEQNRAHTAGVAKADAHAKAVTDVRQKMNDLSASLKLATTNHLTLQEVEKLHGSEIQDLALKAKELGVAIPEAMRQWAEAIANAKISDLLSKANADALKIQAKYFDDQKKLGDKANSEQIKGIGSALTAAKEITREYGDLFLTSAERAISAADMQRDKSLKAIEPLREAAPALYKEMYDKIQRLHDEAVIAAGNAGKEQSTSFGKNFSNYLETDLPKTIMSAITGGGNVFEAIGSSLGGFLVSDKGMGTEITAGLTKILPDGLASAISSMLPGIGALMGPLVSKIAGAIGKAFTGNETKKDREEFASSMGLTLDQLYKKLQSMGEQGERLANQALNVIGKHDEAGNKAWMDQVSKFLDETRQKEEDLAAAAAEAFKTAQDSIGSALGSVITGTIGTQDEFDRLSRIALNTFNTLVQSGVAPVDAMKQIGGAVDVLIASLATSGLQGGAAYDQLARWRTLTTENAPLLDQVSGLNSLMQMTTTLGGMNADVFRDMQAQGIDAYNKLLAAGYTESEARAQIKPLLEQEIQLNKDKGYAIDGATQKIIAQGIANGDLSSEQLSTNDILMQGIGALITALGGELPDAWKKATAATQTAAGQTQSWADVARDAVGGVSSALSTLASDFSSGFSVPIKFAMGDLPDMSGFTAIPMAEGGIGRVTGPTLFLAGEAGAEDYAFSGGGRAFGSGASSMDLSQLDAVHGELQGMRRDLMQVLPDIMESAARHGAQTGGRRR